MVSITTLHEVGSRFGIPVDEADFEIPQVTRIGAQGDVLLRRRANNAKKATTAIPEKGLEIVRGQGGHSHMLFGTGYYDPAGDGANTLGRLTVPADGEVFLFHLAGERLSGEHGALAIQGGTSGATFDVCGQQEMADQIQRVAD